MSLRTYQKLSEETISFENESEFNRYYEKNQVIIDSMKTRGLNLKFKIPGIKIGRQQGKLILFRTNEDTQSDTHSNDNIELKIDNINDKLVALASRFDQLIKILDQILSNSN